MKFQKKLAVTLYTIFIATGCIGTMSVCSDSSVYAESTSQLKTASSVSKGVKVNIRSQNEIREYMKKNSFDMYEYPSYDKEPLLEYPYFPGKVSDSYLESALKALNTVRFIAGIDEVSLRSEYNEITQATSLVNAVNCTMSHYPSQPPDMPQWIYYLGYEGASCSNLAMGYSSIANSIINGYMYDGDKNNIERLGHRRWCLNPPMKYTGFGIVDRYSAMYSFDENFENSEYYGVSWPAYNMPVGYFRLGSPWSISMGYFVDISNVTVTLTRESDMKSWVFTEYNSDGAFYVDNNYYGQPGCIIFCPDQITEYSDGDVYSVNITGLQEPVSYKVNFFDENKDPTEDIIKGDANKDCTINASDLIIYLRYILLADDISEENKSAMDINGDGIINVMDCTVLKRMLLDKG